LTATIERVQRSIERMLDLARGRLSSHSEVVARYPRDVAAVVAQGVDELRRAHPDVRFELLARGPCFAPLDSERFRHVVLELGHHAVELADPASAIAIQVAEHATEVTVQVHHRGQPIEPDLFDPSTPVTPASSRRSTGAGARLFVAHLIVTGHGGRLELSSTAEAGTAVLARLPRLLRAP
jgi:K+-sensing histidine kinase KdpD